MPQKKPDSPFVMDTEFSKANIGQAAKPAAHAEAAIRAKRTQSEEIGGIAIVKNDDPHPWTGYSGEEKAITETTHMVMRMQPAMGTTTGSPKPASSDQLTFELADESGSLIARRRALDSPENPGDALLEIKEGQTHIDVPGTPFEMEAHLMERHRNPRKPIELVRPDSTPPSSLLDQTEPAEEPSAASRVVEVAPHRERLMRGEDLPKLSPVGLPAGVQRPRRNADLPKPSTQNAQEISADKVKEGTHAANAAEAVQSAVNPAITMPNGAAAGHHGSDPSVPLDAQTNDTITQPESIFNATSAEIPLNVSNITSHLPKAVTARGALISICLGMMVTMFFLSVMLALLNAGRPKEGEEQDIPQEPEPPRQTRTYRQLLASQMSNTEATATTA